MSLSFRPSQFPRSSTFPDADPAVATHVGRRAASLAAQGDPAGALRCYQLALLTDESRADLWFEYGMLQLRVGQLADALESFEFALRQDPKMHAARYRMGRVCYEMGHPLEALSHFQMVTRAQPGYAAAWRHVVHITWALGNLGDAEARAREGLQHVPGDPQIKSMLARIVQERADTSDVKRVPEGA